MKYSRLGSSELQVSRVCLGSMTWGIQNNQKDADEQIDYALSRGINFIDTAEMYPVPPNDQTYGDTERHIGNWLSRHPEKRDELIIATKIAGAGLPYIRKGSMISAESISLALDASLERLKTDYIDLYQLHWPNRTTSHFSKHWPNKTKPTSLNVEAETESKRGIVREIGRSIENGKIRHWGLSDDTPWGIHTYIRLCEEENVPKPVSIQNEFSLLHIKDWPYLIESCVFEDVAYLPWSPLAGGLLSGKYIDGARPEKTRFTLVQRNGLFRDTSHANEAVKIYCELAKQFDMTPSQLALVWCDNVDGVTSTIIGATSMSQLVENVNAFDLNLSAECEKAILSTLKEYTWPF